MTVTQFLRDTVPALLDGFADVYRFNDVRLQARRIAGECNPMGVDNQKVAGPATHRSYPENCPPSCAHLKGHHRTGNASCMSNKGNLRKHNNKATPGWYPAAVAATACIFHAQRTYPPRKARLHVTGGLWLDGELDWQYIDCLTGTRDLDGIVTQIKRRLRLPPDTKVAFGYAHVPHGDWRNRLMDHGIHFRLSAHADDGGVITWPFDHLKVLEQHLGRRITRCPHNLRRWINCQRCRLCFLRDNNLIAFSPTLGAPRDTFDPPELARELGLIPKTT